jgi:hypothetical protein
MIYHNYELFMLAVHERYITINADIEDYRDNIEKKNRSFK